MEAVPVQPRIYERASGLYGPGTIYAWDLLFISVLINLATTDLLVRAIELLGVENRALGIYCLRFHISDHIPSDDAPILSGIHFPQTPLQLSDIPPDILNAGQRLVQIIGPLTVCYGFVSVTTAFTIAAVSWLVDEDQHMSSAEWLQTFLLLGSQPHVWLALLIFHCGLGNFSWSLVEFHATLSTLAYAIAGLLTSLKDLILLFNDFFVPDMGIGIIELDQLGALVVGVLGLSYTIFCAVWGWRQQQDPGDTELEQLLPLVTDQGLEDGGTTSRHRRHSW
ncbi:hypothetical protein B0T14DRAFT_570805 [Immersiella caudata]|uniref:Uncharacterized protein n=1 Tax=Immersiella caudata TaxID=314043 RepID=A0AA39U4N3_9PEZI|nr:hypothetical protein B0T14DRAFT_570805 [Immersiella caudata]